MAKYKNPNRQNFLLSFFSDEPKTSEKEVNGFILDKYFSNSTHKWEVAIFTKETFGKKQHYLDNRDREPNTPDTP